MIDRSVRETARNLRSQGYSLTEIAAQLKVAKSSVSYWTRDIQLTPAQELRLIERQRINAGQIKGSQKNREKGAALRTMYQNEGRERAQLMRPVHLAGCMLYWAEGAKSRHTVIFVNSDTEMMQFFMRFLREEMNVTDDKVTLYVHCHSSDPVEVQRITTHWLHALNLPQSSFRKIYHKKGSEVQRSILENGVGRVQINSVRLVQHIYGAIQEYTGLDKPEWLYMEKANKR